MQASQTLFIDIQNEVFQQQKDKFHVLKAKEFDESIIKINKDIDDTKYKLNVLKTASNQVSNEIITLRFIENGTLYVNEKKMNERV